MDNYATSLHVEKKTSPYFPSTPALGMNLMTLPGTMKVTLERHPRPRAQGRPKTPGHPREVLVDARRSGLRPGQGSGGGCGGHRRWSLRLVGPCKKEKDGLMVVY